MHKQNFPNEDVPPAAEIFKDPETFNDAFAIFSCAQALVDHPAAVKLAAANVLKDFHEDNVAYMEIRSTPRSIEGTFFKKYHIAKNILVQQLFLYRKNDKEGIY